MCLSNIKLNFYNFLIRKMEMEENEDKWGDDVDDAVEFGKKMSRILDKDD